MRIPMIGFWLVALAMLLAPAAGCGCGDDDDDNGGADDDMDDDSDDDTGDDDAGDDDVDDDDIDDDDTGDDDTVDPDAQALIDSCKHWLTIGEGDKARADCLAALDIQDGLIEARYGVVLGDMLREFDILSILEDYLLSLANGGPVSATRDDDNWLDSILDELVAGLLYDRGDELIDFADGLAAETDPAIDVDSIPVILHFEHLTDLGTEFDAAELSGAAGLSRIMTGLFRHITAVSLDIDISYAFVIMDIFDQPWDTPTKIGGVVNVLLDMLQDPSFPDFLTLPAENIPELQAAGLSIGDGCDNALNVLTQIGLETDDQSDDVIGFDDLSGDGRWNFDEPLIVPGFGTLDDHQMEVLADVETLLTDLRNSFWDQTAQDVDPGAPNPFPLADLNFVLNELGLPSLIPDWAITRIDFGSLYADPGTDGLKQTLLTILNIADLFLPDPPL